MVADFDCGSEPAAPPQQTTKEVVESYIADALAFGRGCKATLSARGADAARYGLMGGAK